jgi:hypothetical protein
VKRLKTIDIKTDFRIELFSLIVFLSKLDNKRSVDRSENSYTKILKNKFIKFVNHQAISEFPKMWDKGLCWDAIPFLALHLKDDFTFIKNNDISERLKARYDGDFIEIINYLILVRDFAEITNFKQFYDSNKQNEFIAEVNSKASEYSIIELLENYIKLKLSESTIIMSNIFISSFGVTIETENRKQIYCIMSGYSLKVSQKYNGFDRLLLSIIWHEFLHSIINPLTDRLFDNPLEMSDNQVAWYCQLNESIIWAITFRLLLKKQIVDENDGKWYFNNASKNRVPKAKEMNSLLIEYEKKENKYINIEVYYPILQQEFGNPPNE